MIYPGYILIREDYGGFITNFNEAEKKVIPCTDFLSFVLGCLLVIVEYNGIRDEKANLNDMSNFIRKKREGYSDHTICVTGGLKMKNIDRKILLRDLKIVNSENNDLTLEES